MIDILVGGDESSTLINKVEHLTSQRFKVLTSILDNCINLNNTKKSKLYLF